MWASVNLFDHLRLLDGDRVIEKDDCPAFDPDYDTLPLEVFEPMVMRLFEKPRESVYKAAID